jgi:hypothetical protein
MNKTTIKAHAMLWEQYAKWNAKKIESRPKIETDVKGNQIQLLK